MKTNIRKILLQAAILTSIASFAEQNALKVNLGNNSNKFAIKRDELSITSFKIEGLQHVDLYKLMKIDISKGSKFDPEQIKTLMNQIIATGYFQNVVPKVTNDTENKGVDVVLEVVENPVLKSVTINGITVLDVEKLKEKIGLVPNSVYNHYYLDPQKTPIIAELVNAGLLAPAIIDAKMDDGNLTIDVSEGKVTKIEYIKKGVKEENVRLTEADFKTKTRDFVFKRNQAMKVGDYLSINGVKSTAENLFRTGLFDSIEPKFEIDRKNPEGRIVSYEVEERKTASINGGVSYSKDTGVVGEFSISDKNFLGGQQEAALSAQFGTTGSYNFNLSYWNPYIKGTKRLQAGGKIYFSNDKLPTNDLNKRELLSDDNQNGKMYLSGEFSELIKAYETKTFGISGTIGKGIAKDLYISATPKISYSKARTKGNVELRSIAEIGTGVSINYDTRDDIYLPKKGVNITLSFDGNYIFRDRSLTPAIIKNSKQKLLLKEQEITKAWAKDEAKSKEKFKDYENKKKQFVEDEANKGKTFDPIKAGLDFTNAARQELKSAANGYMGEFKANIEQARKESKNIAGERFYGKGELEILAFHPLVKDVNSLAFRFHTGIASKTSPENSMFVTDNFGKTLRGYTDVSTTNFIVSSSLENRFYMNKYLQVVAFADAGIYAKKKDEPTSKGYDDYESIIQTFKGFNKNFRASVGAGIRLYTPIGVLRVDYGLPLINKPKEQNSGKVSFGFGHAF